MGLPKLISSGQIALAQGSFTGKKKKITACLNDMQHTALISKKAFQHYDSCNIKHVYWKYYQNLERNS